VLTARARVRYAVMGGVPRGPVVRYLNSLAVRPSRRAGSCCRRRRTTWYAAASARRHRSSSDAAWIPFNLAAASASFRPEPGGVRAQQQGSLAQDSLAVASDVVRAYSFGCLQPPLSFSYCLPIELQLLRDAGDAAGGETYCTARTGQSSTAWRPTTASTPCSTSSPASSSRTTTPRKLHRRMDAGRCLIVSIQQLCLQFRSLFSVPENRSASLGCGRRRILAG
jgi:hypothetical protein